MSIIDTLITDRTQSDVTKLKSLLSKPKVMWSNEEWSEFLLAKDKGSYNATDLNRVQEAMEYLAERFRGYGYNVPEIKRPSITATFPGLSRLPVGYTQLEYIQSSGTQYIDTNFKPNQNTKLEIKVQTTQTTSGGIAVCDTAWQSNGFGVWINAAGYGNATTQNVAFYGEEPITAILDRNTLYKDGELVWTATESTFQTAFNLTLMALNRNGSPQEKVTGKIYYCKIWDNGALIRNFTPCKNAAGEVGLWDDVNREFYGNAGTGTFAAGPVVPQEMAESDIVELEYIESAGTQCVDTEFMPNQNTRVVIDAFITEYVASYLYGSQVSSGTNFYASGYTGETKLEGWFSAIGTISVDTALKRRVIDHNKNILTTDDGYSLSFSAATFQSSNTMFLFGINNGSLLAPTKAKFFSCQLYDNGVLIRNFIPAKTVAGEIGLYDKVFKEFYRNAGTGTFAAGPEIGLVGVAERDYWEIGDIPRQEQMDQYLTNLGYVKNVLGLLKSTPESPTTMNYLTYIEANAVEQILVDIEFVITHTVQSMSRLNAFMFVSGYRPFPSSISDYGRTWDDIDALELNWDDLDDGEAWYTMQYGVIK